MRKWLCRGGLLCGGFQISEGGSSSVFHGGTAAVDSLSWVPGGLGGGSWPGRREGVQETLKEGAAKPSLVAAEPAGRREGLTGRRSGAG